jgi:hypothetical protein
VEPSGDTASVTFTATYQGKSVTVTKSARRVGGAWRLVDTN